MIAKANTYLSLSLNDNLDLLFWSFNIRKIKSMVSEADFVPSLRILKDLTNWSNHPTAFFFFFSFIRYNSFMMPYPVSWTHLTTLSGPSALIVSRLNGKRTTTMDGHKCSIFPHTWKHLTSLQNLSSKWKRKHNEKYKYDYFHRWNFWRTMHWTVNLRNCSSVIVSGRSFVLGDLIIYYKMWREKIVQKEKKLLLESMEMERLHFLSTFLRRIIVFIVSS